MLKALLRKIKVYGIALPVFYHYRFFRSHKRAGGKAILLDIKKNDFGRYLYPFLKFFHLEGYTIYLKTDLELFYQLIREQYLSFLLTERILHLGKPPKDQRLICFDEKILSADYFSWPETAGSAVRSCRFPMTQHPLMYNKGWWNESLSPMKRKKSLFMAGNYDKKAYDQVEKDGLFNVCSRLTVYSHLQDRQLLHDTRSLQELRTFLDGPDDKKIILINRLEFDVPMNELRHLLAKFDFFFALPGVIMPFAHNIIEGMSAGCIPFIQEEYAKMFSPPLLNGTQAITFTDMNDLEKRVIDLFDLSDGTIESMREQVITYYNNFLLPGPVVAGIEQSNFDKIYVQAEHVSVALYKKRLSRARTLPAHP